MYTFAQHGFSTVHGMDISEELVTIANKNFTLLQTGSCQAYVADALEFKNYADYNIFYFFNPFPEEVF